MNIRLDGLKPELEYFVAQLRKLGVEFTCGDKYYKNKHDDNYRLYLSDLDPLSFDLLDKVVIHKQ